MANLRQTAAAFTARRPNIKQLRALGLTDAASRRRYELATPQEKVNIVFKILQRKQQKRGGRTSDRRVLKDLTGTSDLGKIKQKGLDIQLARRITGIRAPEQKTISDRAMRAVKAGRAVGSNVILTPAGGGRFKATLKRQSTPSQRQKTIGELKGAQRLKLKKAGFSEKQISNFLTGKTKTLSLSKSQIKDVENQFKGKTVGQILKPTEDQVIKQAQRKTGLSKTFLEKWSDGILDRTQKDRNLVAKELSKSKNKKEALDALLVNTSSAIAKKLGINKKEAKALAKKVTFSSRVGTTLLKEAEDLFIQSKSVIKKPAEFLEKGAFLAAASVENAKRGQGKQFLKALKEQEKISKNAAANAIIDSLKDPRTYAFALLARPSKVPLKNFKIKPMGKTGSFKGGKSKTVKQGRNTYKITKGRGGDINKLRIQRVAKTESGKSKVLSDYTVATTKGQSITPKITKTSFKIKGMGRAKLVKPKQIKTLKGKQPQTRRTTQTIRVQSDKGFSVTDIKTGQQFSVKFTGKKAPTQARVQKAIGKAQKSGNQVLVQQLKTVKQLQTKVKAGKATPKQVKKLARLSKKQGIKEQLGGTYKAQRAATQQPVSQLGIRGKQTQGRGKVVQRIKRKLKRKQLKSSTSKTSRTQRRAALKASTRRKTGSKSDILLKQRIKGRSAAKVKKESKTKVSPKVSSVSKTSIDNAIKSASKLSAISGVSARITTSSGTKITNKNKKDLRSDIKPKLVVDAASPQIQKIITNTIKDNPKVTPNKIKEIQSKINRVTRTIKKKTPQRPTPLKKTPTKKPSRKTQKRPRKRLPPVKLSKGKRRGAGATKQGYDVLIREKGKFFKANKQTLPKNRAHRFATDVVNNSSAASYKIVKSGTTAAKDVKKAKLLNLFRKSKRSKNVRVEKRKYRINTPGEKKQITAKGLLAKRRRKTKTRGKKSIRKVSRRQRR